MRIFQAKRLLLTTSLKVTDVSFSVGYNSLGSFTNQFTGSVGVSPGKFRLMSRRGGFRLLTGQPDRTGGCRHRTSRHVGKWRPGRRVLLVGSRKAVPAAQEANTLTAISLHANRPTDRPVLSFASRNLRPGSTS